MSVDTLREECREWTKSKCTQFTCLSFGTIWLCERVEEVEALSWRGLLSQTFTQSSLYTSTPLPIPAPTTPPQSLSYQVDKDSLTHNKQGLSMYKRTLNYRFFSDVSNMSYCKNMENMDNKKRKNPYSQPKPTKVNFMFALQLSYIYYMYTPCSTHAVFVFYSSTLCTFPHKSVLLKHSFYWLHSIYSLLWVYYNSFNHFLIMGQLDCSFFFTIMNNAMKNCEHHCKQPRLFAQGFLNNYYICLKFFICL